MTQPDRPRAEDDVRGEELRLALVLNGGVSLAVWMGGVAYELNRLVRETHPVYGGLLRLTGTTARIDVISGTSAGGINGAALALAQVHDTSLYGLREVWLSTAGLDRLLRDPGEDDPTSLLRGDAYFLPRIEEALAAIATGDPIAVDGAPMLLSLTTTLLRGIGKTQLDDFGAVIEDSVHRAHFVFERREGVAADAFATDSGIVEQLARAARASASFPVAFEPSLHEPDSPLFRDRAVLREQGGRADPVLGPAYLLDGGILDNKPFEAALEAISKLPADRNTRRVLAYVVPDPGAAVVAPPPGPDGKPPLPPEPTLADVAFQSLVGIPATQSIADQLASLREYGDDMRRRWQRISGLLQHTPQADDVLKMAELMFPAYRARRLDGAIDYLLDELARGLAAPRQRPAAGSPPATPDSAPVERLRRSTRLWLRGLWLDTRNDAALWGDVVPTAYSPLTVSLDDDAGWHWGLYALEFMAGVVIDVLRRTQRLADLVDRWQEAHQPRDARQQALVTRGPALPAPEDLEPAPGRTWEQIDRGRSVLRQRAQATVAPAAHGPYDLRPIWQAAYRINLQLRERRQQGNLQAQENGREGFSQLVTLWRRTGTAPAAEARQLVGKLRLLPAAPGTARVRLGHARELCRALLDLQAPIEGILRAMPEKSGERAVDGQAQPDTRADVAEALKELRAYHDFFFPTGTTPTPDALAARLLALEVIEVAAGTREHRPDVGAELVQVSARLQSPWGGPSTPQGKLTGMGLAHFAAFYKRSWRANDWLYGRLDGVDRAVRIALNPDRLQRLYGDRRVRSSAADPIAASVYVRGYVEALAVDGAAAALKGELRDAWHADLEKIVAELAWLDEPALVPPPVLERCAAALTRRLHLEVLMHELPDLALAIDEDEAIGATASAHGKQLRVAIGELATRPADAAGLAVLQLKQGLLGADTLGGEIGSDHFTRLVSQGIAVAQVTASSGRSGLKALNILLKLTEWPIRVFYWLANRLTNGSRTSAALEAATIGIGGALVVASLLADKLPATLTAIGWSLLAGALAATLLRSWRSGLVVVGVSLGIVAVLRPTAALFVIGTLLVLGSSAGTGSLILLVVAAWWSAGEPSWATWQALPCVDTLKWLQGCVAPAHPPDAARLAAATQLLRIGVSAALVILLALILCAPRWFRPATPDMRATDIEP